MKKHLNFYKRCMATGMLPIDSLGDSIYEFGHHGDNNGGLCGCADAGLIDRNVLLMFEPDTGEPYWGLGDYEYSSLKETRLRFTPLRQTIVLFMAAINNEL